MIFFKDIFAALIFFISFMTFGFFITSTKLYAVEDSLGDNIENLRTELSARHFSHTKQSLIELMGSDDALVEGLLLLRRESKPPALGIRAEKLLIGYSDREDVRLALLADIEDPAYFGLGSVVVSSLAQVDDREFRKLIASKSLGSGSFKASSQSRYKNIIEQLDPNILK